MIPSMLRHCAAKAARSKIFSLSVTLALATGAAHASPDAGEGPTPAAKAATSLAALQLAACRDLVSLGRDAAALNCLRQLQAAHPGTDEAALGAALQRALTPAESAIPPPAALTPSPGATGDSARTAPEEKGLTSTDSVDTAATAPDAQDDMVNVSANPNQPRFTFEFGRLEVAAAGLLLGLSAGPAMATAAAPWIGDSAQAGGVLLLGGTLASIGLGVGTSLGGYLLTDQRYFGHLAGRAATAATVYGATLGTAAVGLIVGTLGSEGDLAKLALSLSALAPIVGGYSGLIGGPALNRWLQLDYDQMTFTSVVGAAGLLASGLLIPVVGTGLYRFGMLPEDSVDQLRTLAVASGLTYIVASGLAVSGTVYAAQHLRFSSLDSLIIGASGVFGALMIGGVSVASASSISQGDIFTFSLVASGGTMLGVGGGMITAGALLHFLAPDTDVATLPVHIEMPSFGAVLDSARRPVMTLQPFRLRF
jgi:hypothetical protein